MVMIVCDGDEDESEKVLKEEIEKEHLHLDEAEISLNLVVGLTPNHSMKIRGLIGEQDVVELIDSGATHIVISDGVMKELNLPLTDIENFGMVLGTSW